MLPEVQLIKVHVTETEIWIQWKFDSVWESKRVAEDPEYSVGVQIKYKKESDKEYLTYLEYGSKLPAEQVTHLITTNSVILITTHSQKNSKINLKSGTQSLEDSL